MSMTRLLEYSNISQNTCIYNLYIPPPCVMKRYYIWPFGSCSAPCLFFYLSNARRFYSSMGKLCSLMGLTIWNTRHTGWQSGNYFVTTVCCFPCTGKVPCILATFDYDTINPLSCRASPLTSKIIWH